MHKSVFVICVQFFFYGVVMVYREKKIFFETFNFSLCVWAGSYSYNLYYLFSGKYLIREPQFAICGTFFLVLAHLIAHCLLCEISFKSGSHGNEFLSRV